MFERPLNRLFEARKGERHGDTVSGHLSWHQMPELARVTENAASDQIQVSVRFERTEDNVLAMHLDIQGSVKLVCQRCLDLMDFDVQGSCALAVVTSEEFLARLPEGWEAVFANDDFFVDVHQAVQEELLLRIPMVPKHEEMCGLVVEEDDQPEEKPNPFAVLAQLKDKQ